MRERTDCLQSLCPLCPRTTRFVISMAETHFYFVNLFECQTPKQNLNVSKIQNLLPKKTVSTVIALSFRQLNDDDYGSLFILFRLK
jgi:hypothetical protein